MAYIKTTWKDRLVERPNTFEVQENPDGTITLIPTPGTVTQAGTPVNATNLNKIEDGIVTLENNVTTHLAEDVSDDVHGLSSTMQDLTDRTKWKSSTTSFSNLIDGYAGIALDSIHGIIASLSTGTGMIESGGPNFYYTLGKQSNSIYGGLLFGYGVESDLLIYFKYSGGNYRVRAM